MRGTRARWPGLLALVGALLGLIFAAYSTSDYAAHLDRQIHQIHCSFIPGAAVDSADANPCKTALFSPYSAIFRQSYWGGVPISLFALGAAFGGALGVTTTSGPGLALKAETIGLAVSLELPLIVCDIQRGGPSTGLPTKTEQADLLQALFGRNGESPVAVVAPQSPGDCFDIALEAVRIATTYRTPVIILSDGYLANGSEPWAIPSIADLPGERVAYTTKPNAIDDKGDPVFHPYLRDPETLARPWAVPGTAGLEHRVGGIEKADVTGNISYDPDNHDLMVRLRQAKIDGIADTIPPLEVDDPSAEAKVLVLGWGSTYGPIAAAVRDLRLQGHHVARAHLRHLNPFPANTGEILQAYDRVILPEMNLGQLALLLRARYLVDIQSHTAVRGLPFPSSALAEVILKAVNA